MFEIKRSFSFSLERRKDDAGEIIKHNVPIRMTVNYHGMSIPFYAGHRVDASKWDEAKEEVKKSTINKQGKTASDINNKLKSLSTGLGEFFKECETKKQLPTKQQTKQAFKALAGKKSKGKETFFDVLDAFVIAESKANDWSESAIKKFTTLKNHLVEFDAHLTFESLDENRGAELIEFFRDTKDHRNTYVAKNIKFLKWFLRWAKKKKQPVTDSILEYSPNLKGTDGKIKKVVFLTRDELFHVYNLAIPDNKQYLQRVRDCFCFCCFTGLRHIDLYNLKKDDDKGAVIEFVPYKAPATLIVELNKYSRALLDKYKDTSFPDDKALPVISNQKMNDYLKELGQLAELNSPEKIVYYKGSKRIEEVYKKWELLGTHCGRKTFITNMIYLGVNDNVIMEWTGHSDRRSYDVYHKVVDEIKAKEMAKFNDF